ncbi:glucose 1-dehydrogenase [Phenylobacterium sp. LjRoot225]|uniref:SDR family NAD(P)-dependent oxidoreductase n=1 Tax=Phenylobacterium sp. LjRoot225 TaxID=3342285 RepID=UPI003ED0CDC9
MIEGLLKGKSVVITGAASGVGRAAAELFAQHGARLICADIAMDLVEETLVAVKAIGGEARAVRCDVSKKSEVVAAVAAAVEAYGRLDVIYNNVGIPSPKTEQGMMAKLTDTTDEQIQKLYAVNVNGVIYGCQAAIEQFRIQGGGGVIVNTASVAGLIGWGGVLYGSTKGAVVNLTRTLAIEASGEGIRVNSVCPAGMATRFITGDRGPLPDAALAGMAKAYPLGRVIDPLDTAKAALFLASDLSSNITGVNLPVDGGLSAGKPL